MPKMSPFYHLNFFIFTAVKSQYMSRVMRKPAFCICENKDADQLRGNREADQRLCFRYIDSTIPLLPIYKISSLQSSCVVVQPGLCRTRSETPKTGFVLHGSVKVMTNIEVLLLQALTVLVSKVMNMTSVITLLCNKRSTISVAMYRNCRQNANTGKLFANRM